MPAASTRNLQARLDELGATRQQVIDVALDEIGSTALRALQGAAPIGPTGNFFRGLQQRREEHAVEVGSDAPHAHLVERGRSPGRMAPPALIAALMDLPPDQAFLVARAIGRRGTDGVKVFLAVRNELNPTVQQVAHQLAQAIGGL